MKSKTTEGSGEKSSCLTSLRHFKVQLFHFTSYSRPSKHWRVYLISPKNTLEASPFKMGARKRKSLWVSVDSRSSFTCVCTAGGFLRAELWSTRSFVSPAGNQTGKTLQKRLCTFLLLIRVITIARRIVRGLRFTEAGSATSVVPKWDQ